MDTAIARQTSDSSRLHLRNVTPMRISYMLRMHLHLHHSVPSSLHRVTAGKAVVARPKSFLPFPSLPHTSPSLSHPPCHPSSWPPLPRITHTHSHRADPHGNVAHQVGACHLKPPNEFSISFLPTNLIQAPRQKYHSTHDSCKLLSGRGVRTIVDQLLVPKPSLFYTII
jgi:hypothetical protein